AEFRLGQLFFCCLRTKTDAYDLGSPYFIAHRRCRWRTESRYPPSSLAECRLGLYLSDGPGCPIEQSGQLRALRNGAGGGSARSGRISSASGRIAETDEDGPTGESHIRSSRSLEGPAGYEFPGRP